MKTTETIFQDGTHKWVAIVRDPDKPNFLVDTNEYLVTNGSQGMLIDPGGAEIFPAVFSALSSEFDPSALSAIFASHQDPDVCSSLALWLEFNPKNALLRKLVVEQFYSAFWRNRRNLYPDTG